MAVEVGQEAPDFTLRDQNREEVTLSSYRGQKSVLLVFFPFAFSGICTSELCQVRDELPSFEDEDVQVIGISVDHPFALKSWASAGGLPVPAAVGLLAARRGRAAGTASSTRSAGMSNRGTFLIDKAGKVALRRAQPAGREARPVRVAPAMADLPA